MINKVYDIIKANIDTKICLISDIHFIKDYNTKVFDKIINNIKIYHPEYICIPGDLIDNPFVACEKYIVIFIDFIKELSKISKVYISIGNHDMKYYGLKVINDRFYSKLNKIRNVFVLNNTICETKDIRFIGYTQYYKSYSKGNKYKEIVADELNNLLKIDNKKYNILLSHDPMYIQYVYKNVLNFSKLNLILCGHTHNGLLPSFIKGNTSIISPYNEFFIKKSRGHIKINNIDVIISSGIIKLSKASGIISLFNFIYPLSINYIEIKK